MNRYVKIFFLLSLFLFCNNSHSQDAKTAQRKKELEGQKKKLQAEISQFNKELEATKKKQEKLY